MRLVRLAVAGVLGAGLLAGCSNAPQANETLPSTTRTSASPSHTLPPLGPPDMPMPVEARVQTPNGARAFVSYYVQLMSRAQTSLNSEGLRELSSDCQTCIKFANGIDGYKQQGYRFSGGGIRIDGVSQPAIADGHAEFSLALTQMALDVFAPDGSRSIDRSSRDKAYPASGAAATWSSAQATWLMSELTIQ